MLSPINVCPATHRLRKAGVITLVLLVHGVAVLILMMQPSPVVRRELSVSLEMMAQPKAELLHETPHTQQPKPKTPPVHKSVINRAEKNQLEPPPQAVVASPVFPEQPQTMHSDMAQVDVSAPVSSAIVSTPDTVPDYNAAYLNNPPPSYPMVARRMGWQGKLVLNVEVRFDGMCGEMRVLHSSGHEILDNAAMSTVKGWHFSPATNAGHPVTQWFKVPIVFSLEEK